MDRPAPAASTAPRVADVDEAALDEIKRYESVRPPRAPRLHRPG